MTKKQKVEAIYRQYPDYVNNDMKLLMYVMERQGLQLTEEQRKIFITLDNPEHWTRAARLVRAEHPEWVSEKVRQSREKEFINYRYNAEAEVSPNTLRDKALSLFNN
jgi:hypothetical protein